VQQRTAASNGPSGGRPGAPGSMAQESQVERLSTGAGRPQISTNQRS
jgi:hypothetical protein